jgi:HD-like signal output (HDOD) protein
LIFAIESTSLSRKLCNDEELKIAVGGLGALPTLPKLFQDLTAAINDPYGDTESVSNVIKQDPTVTAKILQVVNSALFAFSRKINSIEQATSILGFSMIRSLVLTAQIINDELPQIDGLSVESLFTHSFRSGLTARLICQHERLSSKEMDTAFTATLLHDIGKVVLLDRLTERYAGALKFARDNDCTDLEAELAVIGCTHAAIGGLLLEVWGLPQETVDAVALHHDPKMLNPRNLNYLGNIVYAANLISYGRDLNTCLKALAKAHGAAHAKTLVQKFKTWQMVCANAEQG